MNKTTKWIARLWPFWLTGALAGMALSGVFKISWWVILLPINAVVTIWLIIGGAWLYDYMRMRRAYRKTKDDAYNGKH